MSAERTEANKAAFRQFHDIVNTGDTEAIAKTIEETIAPDLQFHAPVPSGATGVEGFRRVWAMLLRAFPDLHVAVEDLLAEGDKVVARSTVTGTHQGEYMGLAPTGKSVSYQEIFIVRFAGGRMDAARQRLEESTRLRREIGLLPGAAANMIGLAYIAAAQQRRNDALAILDEAAAIAGAGRAQRILDQVSEARAELAAQS